MRRSRSDVWRWVLGVAIGVLLLGCQAAGTSQPEPTTGGPPPGGGAAPGAGLVITSEAFAEGEAIPVAYTCDGDDISPPLSWEGLPAETESLALIADDPDAPGRTWVHWVAYNIPADAGGLDEAVPAVATLDNGMRQGRNSGRDLGYAGPCPPSGTHRYFFKLYALDIASLDLPDRADKADLLAAIEGHILAEASLMGTYER